MMGLPKIVIATCRYIDIFREPIFRPLAIFIVEAIGNSTTGRRK